MGENDASKIPWPAVSAIASAVSSLATLVVVVLMSLQLRSMVRSTAAASRQTAVINISSAIDRFKHDPDQASYFIQVLNGIAEIQRSGILTNDDIEFLSEYLKRENYLQSDRLCNEWRNTEVVKTPELTKLVETALQAQDCK